MGTGTGTGAGTGEKEEKEEGTEGTEGTEETGEKEEGIGMFRDVETPCVKYQMGSTTIKTIIIITRKTVIIISIISIFVT